MLAPGERVSILQPGGSGEGPASRGLALLFPDPALGRVQPGASPKGEPLVRGRRSAHTALSRVPPGVPTPRTAEMRNPGWEQSPLSAGRRQRKGSTSCDFEVKVTGRGTRREQVPLTLPRPPPRPAPQTPLALAAPMAGGQQPNSRPRGGPNGKGSHVVGAGPWRHHSCQLRVTAPALTRGAPGRRGRGWGDPAAPTGSARSFASSLGPTSPDQGAKMRGGGGGGGTRYS